MKRNRQVGGHPISGHLVWLAINGVYDDPVKEEEIPHLERASRGLGLLWRLKRPKLTTFHLEPLNYP